MTALASSPAFAASAKLGSRVLRKGMRGSDVRTLQHDLTIAGIWTYPSGVFSEGTQIHVKEFQRLHHLSADGIVGSVTVQTLQSVVRGKSRASHRTASPASTRANDPSSSSNSAASASSAGSGGTSTAPPPADAPFEKATLNSQGLAVAPSDAPEVVREVIAAANKIAFKPYVYGGGHASFNSSGYDCSGSVSYALHGAGLLSSPMDSTEFESYGAAGLGKWLTIFANGGHAYMNVAGLWFDTAAQSSSNGQDRWTVSRASPKSGFIIRHPTGW